jgi:hypothetical protein
MEQNFGDCYFLTIYEDRTDQRWRRDIFFLASTHDLSLSSSIHCGHYSITMNLSETSKVFFDHIQGSY